jgi:hypothetical protein
MPAFLSNLLRQLFSIAVLLVFISGCTAEKSKKDMLIEEMALDLEKTNTSINAHTNHTLRQLENKKTELVTMERAGVWLPKAERIFRLTNQYTDYLKILQKKEDSKPDSIVAKTDLYTKEIMNIDERLAAEFSNNIKELKEYTITKYLLKSIADNAFIESLINKTKRIEEKMIAYCNEQVGSVDGHLFFDYYTTIIGQNSTILKPGETLEINAGIGAFSPAAQSKITIGSKIIPLNENGVSVYKTKAASKPGNYKVPIKLSFRNRYTGKEEWKNFNIEYTVVKPCN